MINKCTLEECGQCNEENGEFYCAVDTQPVFYGCHCAYDFDNDNLFRDLDEFGD